MERSEILRAVEIIAACLRSGDDEVERLAREGFAADVARRLAAFVPSAFARPPLEELGVAFADEMSLTSLDGREMRVRLSKQPEYVSALALAREHCSFGVMPRETFDTIVDSSGEVDAVSNARNSGAEVEGSVVASAQTAPIDPRFLIEPRFRRRFDPIGAIKRLIATASR